MLLGDVLAGLSDEVAAGEALIAHGDLALLLATEAAGVRHGETVGEYIAGAVRRFSNLAGDDDWVQLMGALERTDNPAGTCLATMIRWSVRREEAGEPATATVSTGASQCSCGGHGSCNESR